ncbi:putative phage associated protein [Neisseria animaloris]|uniref:phage tail protein n=1 Tax=Neisseria animaloris TaxID=326522 RepID=UPI000A19B320|nr:phage tail protein [Neisseria animaloris]OSI06781.1 phage tail protein [Neisseria animaloris]VEH86560.1 putative phage associated protein [Neisseria animaloris]
MALTLPNGATVHIGELDAEKKVTVATNAAEAVLTANAHGLQNGDFVVLTSGWGELSGRVFKVGSITTNTFNLVGINTTDVNKFPAGGGLGSFRKVKKWTQLTQVMEFTTSGGDQQHYDHGFLEEDFDRQIPTTKSPMSIQIAVGDDAKLPGYQAAVAASNSAAETPMMVRLKTGDQLAYIGYLSVNETPTMVRNEGMKINMAYSLTGKLNRYAAS